MNRLKAFAKKLPFLYKVYVYILTSRHNYQLKTQKAEEIFTRYFTKNTWGSANTVSGRGSELNQTQEIIAQLPNLLNKLNVSQLLDIPCGDFYWMKHVNLDGVFYTGADVVDPLIERNQVIFGGMNRRFLRLNLLKDHLPQVDLIFCRDCLIHFSDQDVKQALKQICESDSTYLLTTTYPEHKDNPIIITGQWRPLNLEQAPFYLPAPLEKINERCSEGEGEYKDKSLGLWSIATLRQHLESLNAWNE